MLAARLSQLGAGRLVSFSQRYEVKWLQFLVRRLYEVPWNCSEASCMMALSSSSGRNENPWSTASLKVPPGGSWPGLVQYTPLSPGWSCPPYAYSLSLMTTPEWRRELPIAQSTVDTLPGGSRSYTCTLTSVLCSDRVDRWLPEVFRGGPGRAGDAMAREEWGLAARYQAAVDCSGYVVFAGRGRGGSARRLRMETER